MLIPLTEVKRLPARSGPSARAERPEAAANDWEQERHKNDMDSLLFALQAFYFIGAVVLTVFVILANNQLPDSPGTTKRVGPTYWGFYRGASARESKDEQVIEAKVSGRDQSGVAGSNSYVRGDCR